MKLLQYKAEPFDIITDDFRHADGDSKPVEIIDYDESRSKSRFFAASNSNFTESNIGSDNFSNVAGKGKLCKAAGLSGAEKKACKKNVKATCGRKPLFGRGKKEVWSKCASGAVVTPEQSALEAAEKLVPSTDSGLGIGIKIMIGAAILGTLGLIGFAISNRMKAKKLSLATQVAGKI